MDILNSPYLFYIYIYLDYWHYKANKFFILVFVFFHEFFPLPPLFKPLLTPPVTLLQPHGFPLFDLSKLPFDNCANLYLDLVEHTGVSRVDWFKKDKRSGESTLTRLLRLRIRFPSSRMDRMVCLAFRASDVCEVDPLEVDQWTCLPACASSPHQDYFQSTFGDFLPLCLKKKGLELVTTAQVDAFEAEWKQSYRVDPCSNGPDSANMAKNRDMDHTPEETLYMQCLRVCDSPLLPLQAFAHTSAMLACPHIPDDVKACVLVRVVDLPVGKVREWRPESGSNAVLQGHLTHINHRVLCEEQRNYVACKDNVDLKQLDLLSLAQQRELVLSGCIQTKELGQLRTAELLLDKAFFREVVGRLKKKKSRVLSELVLSQLPGPFLEEIVELGLAQVFANASSPLKSELLSVASEVSVGLVVKEYSSKKQQHVLAKLYMLGHPEVHQPLVASVETHGVSCSRKSLEHFLLGSPHQAKNMCTALILHREFALAAQFPSATPYLLRSLTPQNAQELAVSLVYALEKQAASSLAGVLVLLGLETRSGHVLRAAFHLLSLLEDLEEHAEELYDLLTSKDFFLLLLPSEFGIAPDPLALEFLLRCILVLPSRMLVHSEAMQQLLAVYLKAYQATMAVHDVLLREVLKRFASLGFSASLACYAFGDALSSDALTASTSLRCFSETGTMEPHALETYIETYFSWFFELAIPGTFPFHRGLQAGIEQHTACPLSDASCAQKPNLNSTSSTSIDPSYMLPVLETYMKLYSLLFMVDKQDWRRQPEEIAFSFPAVRLIQSGWIGYTTLALASEHADVRALAGRILRMFGLITSHLNAFKEQSQILLVLRALQDGLEEPGMRVSGIVATFCADAFKLMLNSNHHMFSNVNAFFLGRPFVDVSDVPLFFKSFNNGSKVLECFCFFLVFSWCIYVVKKWLGVLIFLKGMVLVSGCFFISVN